MVTLSLIYIIKKLSASSSSIGWSRLFPNKHTFKNLNVAQVKSCVLVCDCCCRCRCNEQPQIETITAIIHVSMSAEVKSRHMRLN